MPSGVSHVGTKMTLTAAAMPDPRYGRRTRLFRFHEIVAEAGR
jgi:hypothetical protein